MLFIDHIFLCTYIILSNSFCESVVESLSINICLDENMKMLKTPLSIVPNFLGSVLVYSEQTIMKTGSQL